MSRNIENMFVFAFHWPAVIFERTCLALGFSFKVLDVLPGTLLSPHVCVCFGCGYQSVSLLGQEKQMMVYVERRVADDASLSKDEAFGSIRNQLCTFREGECESKTFRS